MEAGRELAAALSAQIDRVAARFAEPPWEEEIRGARQEYDARRGRIFDDDDIFSLHMATFLEWYVLERPLGGGAPPAWRVLAAEASEASEFGEERRLLARLARSYRTLLQVTGSHRGGRFVLDLVRGGRWFVSCPDDVVGLDAGEICEARLVPLEGRVALGPTVFFHPRAAEACVRGLVAERARQGKLDARLVDELAEMRLHYGRFRQIDVEHIYCDRATRGPSPGRS